MPTAGYGTIVLIGLENKELRVYIGVTCLELFTVHYEVPWIAVPSL
jgi:hypothetical protein